MSAKKKPVPTGQRPIDAINKTLARAGLPTIGSDGRAPLPTIEKAAPLPKLSDQEFARMATAFDSMKQLLGINSDELIYRLVLQAARGNLPYADLKTDEIAKLELVVSQLRGLGASNVTEGMLAAQMLAVHDASLFFLNLATLKEQAFEARDMFTNRAARLMEVFTLQITAMQKLKGNVTQQHVHVHYGGGVCKQKQRQHPIDSGAGNSATAILPETSQVRRDAVPKIEEGRLVSARRSTGARDVDCTADCQPVPALRRGSAASSSRLRSTAAIPRRNDCKGNRTGNY